MICVVALDKRPNKVENIDPSERPRGKEQIKST